MFLIDEIEAKPRPHLPSRAAHAARLARRGLNHRRNSALTAREPRGIGVAASAGGAAASWTRASETNRPGPARKDRPASRESSDPSILAPQGWRKTSPDPSSSRASRLPSDVPFCWSSRPRSRAPRASCRRGHRRWAAWRCASGGAARGRAADDAARRAVRARPGLRGGRARRQRGGQPHVADHGRDRGRDRRGRRGDHGLPEGARRARLEHRAVRVRALGGQGDRHALRQEEAAGVRPRGGAQARRRLPRGLGRLRRSSGPRRSRRATTARS